MRAGTWLPVTGSGGDAFERVFRVRPELYEGYRAFHDQIVRESGFDAGLVGRCGARVTWLLTAVGDEPVAVDALERAVFAYADAFVRDPHGVTDEHVAALRAFLSVPQVVGLTELLALLDGFTRFRLILGAGAA